MSEFYVYIHRRKDDGQVFYIGKGKGRRSHDKRRNGYWRNTARKHGYSIEFAAKGLSEAEAISIERQLIAAHKILGAPLTNMTDGGEGMSGYIWPTELKLRQSAILKSRLSTPEARKKRSLEATLRGKDPSYRAKQSISNKKAKSSPNARRQSMLNGRKRNTDDNPMVGIWDDGGRFRVRITHDRKQIMIGSFGSLEEARTARIDAENRYWGENGKS